MVEERMSSRDKPWPDAPLRDRVLMMCAQFEDGWERDQIASRLHVPAVLLGRTLAQLVREGWLQTDSSHAVPRGAVLYTLVEDRPGLREMKTIWYLEHGFVEDELQEGLEQWEPAIELDERERALLDQAVAYGPRSDAAALAPVYRQLRAAAREQSNRTRSIWHNMQTAWFDARVERARDMIHLEGDGLMELPVPQPTPSDPTCRRELLLLALTCRRRAREVAGKFHYLVAANAAATARILALNSGRHAESNALQSLVATDSRTADAALRQALTGAASSKFLKDQWRWATSETAGLGGDLMIAYLYRNVARQLEEIVASIVEMPAVAAAAESKPGRELLGEAASLFVSKWSGIESCIVTADLQSLSEGQLGERIEVGDPAQLQAGQRIVALDGKELATQIVVVSAVTERGVVSLAVPEGPSEYVVPIKLLELGTMTVREPLR
ncbi:MAG: hypothetical protein ACTIB2_08915 [Brachybacterium tyrofermentans]